MSFEHVPKISLNYDKQTCDRQSTCYQRVLKFHLPAKQMFSNSICLGLIECSDENAPVLISAVLPTREHVDSQSQRIHGWQTLLKSAWQHFHLNFALTQNELSSKTFLLVRCEILALFGNTLTAAHMDSRHNSEKFQRHSQTGLSQKPPTFSDIFIAFLQSI